MDVDFLGIRLILLGFLIDQRVNGAVIHQTPQITMTTQAKLTTGVLARVQYSSGVRAERILRERSQS